MSDKIICEKCGGVVNPDGFTAPEVCLYAVKVRDEEIKRLREKLDKAEKELALSRVWLPFSLREAERRDDWNVVREWMLRTDLYIKEILGRFDIIRKVLKDMPHTCPTHPHLGCGACYANEAIDRAAPACPVVMQPDTLRALLAAKDAAESSAEAAESELAQERAAHEATKAKVAAWDRVFGHKPQRPDNELIKLGWTHNELALVDLFVTIQERYLAKTIPFHPDPQTHRSLHDMNSPAETANNVASLCNYFREAVSRAEAAESELAQERAAHEGTRHALLKAIKERDDWKHDSLMYSKAWEREIGPPYRNKTHHIDALVLTTQDRIAERDAAVTRAESAEAREAAMRSAVLAATEGRHTCPHHPHLVCCACAVESALASPSPAAPADEPDKERKT